MAPGVEQNGEKLIDPLPLNYSSDLRSSCHSVAREGDVPGVVFMRHLFHSCRDHGVLLVATPRSGMARLFGA